MVGHASGQICPGRGASGLGTAANTKDDIRFKRPFSLTLSSLTARKYTDNYNLNVMNT